LQVHESIGQPPLKRTLPICPLDGAGRLLRGTWSILNISRHLAAWGQPGPRVEPSRCLVGSTEVDECFYPSPVSDVRIKLFTDRVVCQVLDHSTDTGRSKTNEQLVLHASL